MGATQSRAEQSRSGGGSNGLGDLWVGLALLVRLFSFYLQYVI